jgi:membrane protease YdiL (CAAX protease family)
VGWGLRKWWYIIPFVLGNHTQGAAYFALNLLLSLFAQSLLGSIVTMGEEFGWRGYVQEKLMFIASWGVVAGLCLLSLNRKKPQLWQNADGLA